MSQQPMRDLPKGAVFSHFTGHPRPYTRYEITVPAAEHPNGWVEVLNLDMTDAEAAAMPADPREPDLDPRAGFFAYSVPVMVEVIKDGL